MKIRILPLTILTLVVFVGGKAFDLASTAAIASSAPKGGQEKTVYNEKGEAVKPGEEKKEEGGHGSSAKKEEVPSNLSYEKPEEKIPVFTESEKEVLERLASRRTELDAYSKELEMRESMIEASSKKLDEKLAELKTLKADTETLLANYNEKEDAKIRSLVKVYENMKPKSAAEIFEEMDMNILLEIVDKMSERKVSPILAGMSTKKAKELTEELANQRSLRPKSVKEAAEPKAEAAPAPKAAPVAAAPAAPAEAQQASAPAATSDSNPAANKPPVTITE